MNPLLLSKEPEVNSSSYFADILSWLTNILNNQIYDILQSNSWISIGILMAIAFGYGIVHAAGPGHGKVLVASYFASNERSYLKGILASFAIAIVHTFSALVVTLVAYFVFEQFYANNFNESTKLVSSFFGIVIVAIAIRLFVQKLKHYKTQTSTKSLKWSTTLQSSCSCSSCQNKNQSDLAIILSVGLIPCPGTIAIFLFSISLGLFYIGFLSAVFMSLGMGLVIALSAMLGIKTRNATSARFSKFIKYFDFTSVFVMFAFGLLLVFGL